MAQKETSKGYFYTKIEHFDFDKFYSKKMRFSLHFLMWGGFGILLMLTYQLAYKLTFFEALMMTLRMTSVNMSVFYVFFYLIFPKFTYLNRFNSILLLLMSGIICGILWLFVTYLFSKIYVFFGIDIANGELKGAISMSANQTLKEAISPKRLIAQAMIIFANLSPFFFFKILFEIFRVYNKVLKIQKQKASLEIENINIEKDFLKAQLNPHFLFNTLNNLYGLTIKKEDSAPEMILNLSEIMSYTLYESNTTKVPLSKELAFIQNYFQLEKMRYSNENRITLDISNFNHSNLMIAPLLTFTFIENAFKYGLKNKANCFLHLKIEIKEKDFRFHLQNDKMVGEENKNVGGIGTENARKRLQLLYPSKHRLTIHNCADTFEVKLSIDLD